MTRDEQAIALAEAIYAVQFQDEGKQLLQSRDEKMIEAWAIDGKEILKLLEARGLSLVETKTDIHRLD